MLATYEPWELVYRSPRGEWTGPPRTLQERIANELWHRLYQAHLDEQGSEQIVQLLALFSAHRQHWSRTRRLHEHLAGEGVPFSPVQATIDVCVRLLELAVLERLVTRYVPPWDVRAQEASATFRERHRQALDTLARAWEEAGAEEWLVTTSKHLAGEEFPLTAEIVRVLVHEEELRQRLGDLLASAPLSSPGPQEPWTFFGEQLGPSIGMGLGPPQALLRPCLGLLELASVPVSSGLQFEAVNIVSRLCDSRSAGALRRLLARTPAGYTNLRCAALFALGNLRDPQACQICMDILRGPECVTVQHEGTGQSYEQPLHREKTEAIWALGKLGTEASPALPLLSSFAEHTDRDLRVALAWSLGQIGKAQKEKQGGIDAEVVIALLRLLASREPRAVEEAAFALRNLELPDFLHTLYLHDFAAMPILALKPCSTGLYELSETLFHLMEVKHPVVMAVTGDSGTGKTYFCQAIAQGFAHLRASDILYLMRDKPANRIFNRLLGMEWLRTHVEPQYYQDDSIAPEEDDPERYFEEFMAQHASKKLIILDGWRDEAYFHRVIERFYERGFLDVIVSFRTTYSTRRLNLEQREGNLESVSSHLSLVEDPPIEGTRLYREGEVLIYNLDNSIPSRLTMPEIQQVFAARKVRAWGEHISIGPFLERRSPLSRQTFNASVRTEHVEIVPRPWQGTPPETFLPEESSFVRLPNPDLASEPHLLETLDTRGLEITKVAFYTHGQVAFGAEDGRVGIMVGFNDRLFAHRAHRSKVEALSVLGAHLCSVDQEGHVHLSNFENGTHRRLPGCESPACHVVALPPHRMLTGHRDGRLTVWELDAGLSVELPGCGARLLALAADRRGRVYGASDDGSMRIWTLARGELRTLRNLPGIPQQIAPYPDGRVAVALLCEPATEEMEIAVALLDHESGEGELYRVGKGRSACLTAYPDGRLFIGAVAVGQKGTLGVVDPRPGSSAVAWVSGHGTATTSCLTMGPRIITCAQESDQKHTVKIWGAASYVQQELSHHELLSPGHPRPAYYRTLF
ncbi:MAG: HEAT repeat domain-containing protein [bacterium]|nr:HEAT repeat domain-containing protein [candidate division KSB1 bacterium]MDH7560019.1 HEAT repeat domain-containing protein [bacterium]